MSLRVCSRIPCAAPSRIMPHTKDSDPEAYYYYCGKCRKLIAIPYADSKRGKRARRLRLLFLLLPLLLVGLFLGQGVALNPESYTALWDKVKSLTPSIPTATTDTSEDNKAIGNISGSYYFNLRSVLKITETKRTTDKVDFEYSFSSGVSSAFKNRQGYLLLQEKRIYFDTLPNTSVFEANVKREKNKLIFTAKDSTWKITKMP